MHKMQLVSDEFAIIIRIYNHRDIAHNVFLRSVTQVGKTDLFVRYFRKTQKKMHSNII